MRSKSDDRAEKDRNIAFKLQKSTAYDSAWGIPSAYVHPDRFWRPKDGASYSLERGFCSNFNRGTSFNSNAAMNPADQQRIETLITQFKWFTRNSETDMGLPFNERLLYDKRFTNIAQAMLKKQMLKAPDAIYYDKFGTAQVDMNIIYSIGE